MTDATDAPALAVRGLSAGYGVMQVVSEVDLEVGRGEIVCLIGRNGAGKTTAVRAIAGLRAGRGSGSVLVTGAEVGGSSPAAVVSGGLSLVPDGHRVFGELSVRDNLRMGGFARRHDRRAVERAIERVNDLFPVLAEYRDRSAGNLSGGEQQMVAIGQALVSDPQVLVLDEPSSGLALGVVAAIYQALRRLRDEGMAILVVEQNVERALQTSDRGYVLDGGRVVISGRCDELRGDARVAATVAGTAR